MKNLILLFSLITYLGYSQDDDLNKIFLNIPLNESRISTYEYLSDATLFIKSANQRKLIRKGEEIKIFSGHLKELSAELIKEKIDSVEVQLSSGHVSIEGEKESKELFIFWTYFYTSDIKSAQGKYNKLKKQISKICKEKPYYFKNFEIAENEDVEKEVGYNEKWYFMNEANLEIELKYTILKENEKYLILLGYSRYE